MNKPSFTPSKYVDTNENGDYLTRINDQDGYAIDVCFPPVLSESAPSIVQLWSSAPALHAALEGLLDQIENGIPFKGDSSDMKRESVIQARTALAAASGNTVYP